MHAQDLSNIDEVFLKERPIDSPCISKLSAKEMKKYNFDSFSYSKDSGIHLISSSSASLSMQTEWINSWSLAKYLII